MSQYKLVYWSPDMVLRDWETAVPLAIRTNHPDYLAWRAQGNTPDPADPAPVDSPDQVADAGAIANFPSRAQVQGALDQIDTDLATLSGTPTNVQLAAILRRTVINQKNIIRAVGVLVRRAQ